MSNTIAIPPKIEEAISVCQQFGNPWSFADLRFLIEKLAKENDELEGTVRILSAAQTALIAERDREKAVANALAKMRPRPYADADKLIEERDQARRERDYANDRLRALQTKLHEAEQ